jgi:hypothetical protein
MVAVAVAAALWTANTASLLAVIGAGLIFACCWGRPRVALTLWLLSLTMVPIWISVHFLANVPFHCVVAVVAAAATVNRTRITVTVFEAYLGLFFAVSFLAVLFGDASDALWAQMLVRWGIPFLAARILVSATGIRFATDLVAFIFALVGLLAVAELIFVWHPFVEWNFPTPEFATWHVIQARGGSDRSEWAFGHSIALGASLALSIPFIMMSSHRRSIKTIFLLLVFAGIVATASRASLLAAVLTVAICLSYFGRERSVRTMVLAYTLAAAVIVVPYIAPVLQAYAVGNSGEEQVSAGYRDSLYSTYLTEIEWFGRSPAYYTVGGTGPSIDSAVLRIGLAFGWVVLILVLIPVVLSTCRVIAGRASTGEMAIVGQIPLFATVALITQYESMVFIVAGIAAQAILTANDRFTSSDEHSTIDAKSAGRPGHAEIKRLGLFATAGRQVAAPRANHS